MEWYISKLNISQKGTNELENKSEKKLPRMLHVEIKR